MNGRQLNGLCKVLNVFQDTVLMDYPIVIDDTHVMMCEVGQTPMFGIDGEYGLDVKKILKMNIEDEDFDVSIENGRYVVRNENRTYSFLLKEGEGLKRPKAVKLDVNGCIETDAKTLLKAVEKCMSVSDWCVIQDGRMSAKNDDTDVSVVLGKDDGSGCRSRYGLDWLRKICKVMTGKVVIYFDTDYPMKMCWGDGWYDYMVMIAPRVDRKE